MSDDALLGTEKRDSAGVIKDVKDIPPETKQAILDVLKQFDEFRREFIVKSIKVSWDHVVVVFVVVIYDIHISSVSRLDYIETRLDSICPFDTLYFLFFVLHSSLLLRWSHASAQSRVQVCVVISLFHCFFCFFVSLLFFVTKLKTK